MKITETKLRSTIKNLILEYDLIKLTEKAKPYIASDPGLFYWLRNNYSEGFTMEPYALNPVATSQKVMNMMDSDPRLKGLKVVGKVHNRSLPFADTFLFLGENPEEYVITHVVRETGKGIIAKGFGRDRSLLSQIVNYITPRKKPALNPALDQYISAF